MRHRKHRQTLGVTREHRAAMLSNLAAALIRHGRIETTLAKARALRPFVEKIVTKAKKAAAASEKKDALHHRRLALRKVRDEDAVTLLFNEKAAQFARRPGGYTRIYKLSPRRVSDAAEMALIEFVGADDQGYKKRARRSGPKVKKTRPEPARGVVDPELVEREPARGELVEPVEGEKTAEPAPEGPKAAAPSPQ